jgi:hypothetical protein
LGYRSASPGVQSRCTILVKPYEENSDEDEEDAGDADAEAFAVASLIEEMLNTDSYLIPSQEGFADRRAVISPCCCELQQPAEF